MTGLIWVVQLVHYPTFNFVEKNNFQQFSAFHQSRITWIVAPIMTLEALTAATFLWFDASQLFYWINFFGVLAIWLVTLALSMPQHAKLSKGFTPVAIRKLIVTNWLRTAIWSVRSISLILYLGVQL